MIENKDLPEEFVSIRQVWLRQINRCTEAITNRYKTDISVRGGYADVSNVGSETLVESIMTLYHTLVDYGEATIKSDVAKWIDDHTERNIKDKKFKDRTHYFRKMFEFIIETLNKYGMLFDSTPKGYSNTIMKSVEKEGD
jgi:hypothetical protein